MWLVKQPVDFNELAIEVVKPQGPSAPGRSLLASKPGDLDIDPTFKIKGIDLVVNFLKVVMLSMNNLPSYPFNRFF